MARKWNPLGAPQNPGPDEIRMARILAVIQLPVGAYALWFIWTNFWSSGSGFATFFAIFMTVLGLAIVVANLRNAWFIDYDRGNEDEPLG